MDYFEKEKESQKKIKEVFIELIQNREIREISVTEVCQLAKINRSTFYASYLDIYDLADKLRDELKAEVFHLYQREIKDKFNSNDYLKLFRHIKENQLFYKTYFKLKYDTNFTPTHYDRVLAKEKYDNKFIEYHMIFFMSGLNAIIKKWLQNDCRETPEEMYSILQSEYRSMDK